LYSLDVIITEILTGKKGYHDVGKILDSWSNRSDNIIQREQILVCAEIGMECIESEPRKRPVSMKRVIDRLLETETKQTIPAAAGDPSELLVLRQYAMCFLLEPNKQVAACPLELTNNTDRHVAFRLMDKNGESCLTLPLYGIVHPGCSHTLIVTTQEHKQQSVMCNTDLTLDSATMLGRDHINKFQRQPDNFLETAKKTGYLVQEVTLKAFYIPWKLFEEGTKPKALSLSLLQEITNGFSNELEIGRGNSMVIYKGTLDDGTFVAVKRLHDACMKEKEFHQEVEYLMKVKHTNIVRFLGYCAETTGTMVDYNGELIMVDILERLLCFEYLPKGTLEYYIKDSYRDLEWSNRYKIIKGICEGLNYLHQQNILHLGLEPSNILLDEDMIPKIIDFSRSRCHFYGNMCHFYGSVWKDGIFGTMQVIFGTRIDRQQCNHVQI